MALVETPSHLLHGPAAGASPDSLVNLSSRELLCCFLACLSEKNFPIPVCRVAVLS